MALHAAPAYRDVAAIFAARCYGCHATSVKMGSLNLETYDGIQQGGNHGKIIVAGSAVQSRLYQMITGKLAPAMPMDNTKLSVEETAAIKAWIDAGAPAPTEAAVAAALPRLAPKSQPRASIYDLAYSPDGKLIAFAGFREVRLIDAATKQTVATLTGAADAVRSVAFSRDGTQLAAAGGLPARSGEVLIFDIAQRKRLHTLRGHSDCIYAIAFSPDGRTLASGSYDKFVKLWDLAAEKEIRTYKDHIDAVYAIAFTRDGQRLISGAADRTVKIWNVATAERLYTLSESQDGINTLALDPTGSRVAAAGLDKSIRIWTLADKSGTLENTLIAHEDAILKLAWSPDGATLLSSSADRTVKMYRAKDLAELKSWAESDWAYGLQFSPDGKNFAAGRFDGTWELTPAPAANQNMAIR
ncbi:MAG: hypothetical protein M3O35_09995 [Acidobacteriota bacterium]|nr:hypothetical protein [Acidobacteriota bacterium]